VTFDEGSVLRTWVTRLSGVTWEPPEVRLVTARWPWTLEQSLLNSSGGYGRQIIGDLDDLQLLRPTFPTQQTSVMRRLGSLN